MLSVLLGTTTITMNRGEQETLYRQARNLRLHQESKAQHNSSQTLNAKPRHHSYGNIHQIHSTTSANFPKQVMNYRNVFGNEQHPCDDLVLSVLKSPLRDQSVLSNLSSAAATSANSVSVEGGKADRISTVTTLTAATIDNAPSPQGVGRDYTTLQASEDDLADDVELAMETTELNSDEKDQLNNPDLSPYGLKFLRRFRAPKFEGHHRRVPTPMRRKNNRSKSTADILDGVNEPNRDEPDEVTIQNGAADGIEGGKLGIISETNISRYFFSTNFQCNFSFNARFSITSVF
jgi:hypothetical protein